MDVVCVGVLSKMVVREVVAVADARQVMMLMLSIGILRMVVVGVGPARPPGSPPRIISRIRGSSGGGRDRDGPAGEDAARADRIMSIT